MQSPAQYSEQARQLLREHGGDVSKVAASLNVSAPRAALLVERELIAPEGPTYVDDYWQRPAELGRPKLTKFIVSSRHINEIGWPKVDRRLIETARRNYEAGTHEMCSGRDGQWIILYSIPRKKKVAPRTWFTASRHV